MTGNIDDRSRPHHLIGEYSKRVSGESMDYGSQIKFLILIPQMAHCINVWYLSSNILLVISNNEMSFLSCDKIEKPTII